MNDLVESYKSGDPLARAVIIDKAVEGTPTVMLSVVTYPRGSWKYQDAYRVARYIPRQTKSGKWIWVNDGYATGKMSEPQLRRAGWNTVVHSYHNQPI